MDVAIYPANLFLNDFVSDKSRKRGLEISTAIGDRSGIANNNGGLGNAYLSLGEYQKAIDHYKTGLEISTAIGDRSGIASNNGNLGNAYLSLGEYQKAIDHYKTGLEISTAIGYRSGIASNNSNLGNAYERLGEYQKAIGHYKTGLEISTAIGDRSGIASNNGNLGNAYRCLGEYQKAIDHYKRGLEISTAIGDRSGIANNNGNLGNAYLSLGEYQKAIDHYKTGLEISTAIGDRSGIASNNEGLGSAYDRLGEYQKAIGHYKTSLEISTAIGDRSGIANDNGGLGYAYLRLGEYQKAIDHYNTGLEISTAIGDRSGIANDNGGLGNAYLSLGEYQKAIDHYKTGLEISTAIGDRSGIASKNCNLGNAYFSLGEYQKAIDHYKTGLEISTAIGDRSGIASNNGNLGNAYLSLGEYQKAIDHYKTGLEISTAIGYRSGIASNNSNLGNAYLSLEEYQKAIDHYKTGLEISTAIGDRPGIAIHLSNLGNAHRYLGEYEVGIPLFLKSISLFDRMFLDFVPDQNMLSFTIQYFVSHKYLMSCFLSLERIESALLVIDIGRAKELHFCLEKHKNSVDKDMFDYARGIWNRIEAREERREMEEMKTFLHLGENDTSVLVFAFDLEGFLNVWVLNDEVIFRKLDACLETFHFLIMELLGRENVRVVRNSSFCNSDSVVNTPFENTTCYSDFYNREILERLFKLLVDPVKDLVKGNKLIVVPDQELFFTPFSALIDENGSYLSNSYSVQITPSLHTLKCTMEQSCDSNFGFALFVGNPTVGRVSLNGEDVTPRGLPYAAEEVICLSKLFQTRPFLGREASKEVVLQHLSEAGIIHIAAHGEPNRGEIMLAPNSSQEQPGLAVPKPESYLLTQRDILNTSVQARLVVLCCCQTGQGKITSEGVIGITRAFLVSGMRCVLATLWPIDDIATKEFMEKFYGELCQGTSVCESLRRTMNLFQTHEIEAYRSSRIWGPFTIYGEDAKFHKNEIEQIREKSREMFSDFVVLKHTSLK
ncbi:tetratricopeptide repeat 28-like [Paramuricea clavata]|uniref:Tetratricopeptide repeat 28-like n=1 Tax=Paramuricea clavata TaxID=317549 RepID=A0A6S7HZF4_PARCT|nr:tetratricopeptide repeat 28-like [Paramuricea clavata]